MDGGRRRKDKDGVGMVMNAFIPAFLNERKEDMRIGAVRRRGSVLRDER